jgi:hypothetical protein
MPKFKSLLFLSLFFSLASKSQTNSEAEKECRITTGIGFAAATKSTQSVGKYVWLQLDYKFYKNISIATEFENMTYKLKGFYNSVLSKLNQIKSVDNNFSLLFKYNIGTKSPLKIAVASGWTYTIRTREYYIYESDSATQRWYRNVNSYDDYQVPLLLELEYPLWKTINVHGRIQYNLNPQNGSTYSSGVGLSLKL